MADITAPETINITPQEFRFATSEVQPSGSQYLCRDDRVFVRVWNSAAGVNIEVRGRLLLPNGEISPFSFPFTPTTARALSSTSFDLAEGFLLDVCVIAAAGTPRRGQCFVQIGIVRGAASNFEITQLLISDYVTNQMAIAYPGGTIKQSIEGPGVMRSITGTDPAAGVEISETVPSGARWRLLGLTIPLVTSAAVANRVPVLTIDDGALVYGRGANATALVASNTYGICAGAGQPLTVIAQNVVYLNMMEWPVMMAGHRFRTITGALDAGDNYGPPQYLVEEWIEP